MNPETNQSLIIVFQHVQSRCHERVRWLKGKMVRDIINIFVVHGLCVLAILSFGYDLRTLPLFIGSFMLFALFIFFAGRRLIRMQRVMFEEMTEQLAELNRMYNVPGTTHHVE